MQSSTQLTFSTIFFCSSRIASSRISRSRDLDRAVFKKSAAVLVVVGQRQKGSSGRYGKTPASIQRLGATTKRRLGVRSDWTRSQLARGGIRDAQQCQWVASTAVPTETTGTAQQDGNATSRLRKLYTYIYVEYYGAGGVVISRDEMCCSQFTGRTVIVCVPVRGRVEVWYHCGEIRGIAARLFVRRALREQTLGSATIDRGTSCRGLVQRRRRLRRHLHCRRRVQCGRCTCNC